MKENQRINLPPVGVSLPFVSLMHPSVLPFVGQKLFTRPSQHGFTLIELMTVLVVAAILIGIAVPNISSFIQNSRMISQTNALVADFNFARSEAIKRSTSITICKSSNSTAVSPTCNTSGNDWAIGRIVFIDTNSNGTIDAGETVLRAQEPLDGGNTLRAGANLANYLLFAKTGITTLSAATLRQNEFALCDQRGPTNGRSIVLEITGRATIKQTPTDCSPS